MSDPEEVAESERPRRATAAGASELQETDLPGVVLGLEPAEVGAQPRGGRQPYPPFGWCLSDRIKPNSQEVAMNTPESVLKELGDYQAWLKRNPGIDLFDYATLAVSADAFIAVLEVLEPGLIEHNGAYFRARDFTVSAYDAWAAKLSDVVAIQRVMNHIHVSQFFREQEVPYCVLEVIASQIAKHWNQSFADRGLMAAYYGDGTDVEVTFFGVSSDRSPRPHGHGMV